MTNTAVMGLHQLWRVLLVPHDSLPHFSQLKINFINQNGTTFIQDMCCHLMLCLHLIELNWSVLLQPFLYSQSDFGFCSGQSKMTVAASGVPPTHIKWTTLGEGTRHCLLSLQSVEMEGNFFPSLHWRDIFASLHPLASGKKFYLTWNEKWSKWQKRNFL